MADGGVDGAIGDRFLLKRITFFLPVNTIKHDGCPVCS